MISSRYIISSLPIDLAMKPKDCARMRGQSQRRSLYRDRQQVDMRLEALKDLLEEVKWETRQEDFQRKNSQRRAQTFKATAPSIVECPKCQDMMLSHRVCKNCGTYDGVSVIAVEAE